ncbi:MAG TPA: hypothetical protein VGM92_14190 [Candidatus Kapabacteria bacterium]
MPQFDVTPKEYARVFNIHPATARDILDDWFRAGDPDVKRSGRTTKRFPNGKLIRLSRERFERLLK